MPESVLIRTPEGFIPQDDELDGVKIGEGIKVTWKKARSPGNHKRFFKFRDRIFDMQDHFTDREVMRKWLIMKAGYFTTGVAPNGTVMFFPDSMSWDDMDEDTFRACFDKMITVVVQELGLTQEGIERALEFV